MFSRRVPSIFYFGRSFCSKLELKPAYVMDKIEPVTTNIESQDFRELFTPELIKLQELFKKRNYPLRIAGGAVRDLLMNIKPADVDFATTATPTEMKDLFESEQIRMLHKRGEEHGTITCRIDDTENFEITTLRVDVVCDGRRAEVEYTTDWQLDANRRDLTINSLFLCLDGTVVDYFNGIKDIESRRIAFVGNSRQRMQEDYLRILRYFRFFGRISNTPEHETDTLQAIIENKDGLKGISAERIWTELKKIVIGRMAPDVLSVMIRDCKLNSHLGLPDDCNLERFKNVFDRFSGSLEPMTMVACLCDQVDDIDKFHVKTKLSNDERRLGEFVIGERQQAIEHVTDEKWWINKIVVLEVRPGHETTLESVRNRVVQLAKSVLASDELIQMIREFKTPSFPITGITLMEAGVKRGPNVRNVLNYLFDIWANSCFTMNKEELLEHANDPDIPDLSKKRNRSKSPVLKK